MGRAEPAMPGVKGADGWVDCVGHPIRVVSIRATKEYRLSFEGVYVPVITPFDNEGGIDRTALAEFVEILIASGVEGLVAAGTTGEAYALTIDERHIVISTIVKQAAGRVPVLAGVGGLSTNEAVGHAALAKRMDCDGLMVAAPAYALPTPSELASHVTAVVNSVGMLTCLYDYPARTGVSFSQETLDALADNPHIQGIKEASGDLSRIDMLQSRYAGRIDIVCGADADSAHFMDRGVKSWIGGMANALPKAHRGIMDDSTRAAAYAAVHPILEFIESGRYIAKTKALLGILGVPCAAVRGPLGAATQEDIDTLTALVAQAGEWAPSLA
jgi:4-hydroxy-tetrahydrodipicolinate synthase